MNSAVRSAIAALLLVVSNRLAAQECACEGSPPVAPPNFAVYVEVGGLGLVSLNVERKLNESFRVRLGRGWWHSFDMFSDQPGRQARVHVPMLQYLWRPDGTSPAWLEAGAGVVTGNVWEDFAFNWRQQLRAIIGNVGFRYMRDHFVFRLGLAPAHIIRGDFPGDHDRLRLNSSIGVGF